MTSEDGKRRLFDGVPEPADVYAKAFSGALDEDGHDTDDMLLGYIECLYDQDLVTEGEMSGLVGAAMRGGLERSWNGLRPQACTKCGRPWDAVSLDPGTASALIAAVEACRRPGNADDVDAAIALLEEGPRIPVSPDDGRSRP